MKKLILLTAAVALAGCTEGVGSHYVAPRESILPAAHLETRPVNIQVVALDWKWLFIYPDEGVATVNELTIPVGRTVHFDLASSGATNSFFVPQLGARSHARAGTVTQLELQADHPGTYRGLSAPIGGKDLSDMNFVVSAVSAEEFAQWVAAVRKAAGPVLDAAAYADLTTPSAAVPPFRFHAVAPNVLEAIAIARP